MTKRCLITGGSGFFGGHIVRSLASAGWEVVAPSRAILDVGTEGDFHRIQGRFDAVIHAAAVVPSGTATPGDVPTLVTTSALGTHNALTFAAERGAKRFVYVSSADVYSSTAALPVSETAPTDPHDGSLYYGLGKLWGDQLCRAFRKTRDLATVSLRFSQLHGPGMRSRGVVSAFWRRASNGETLSLHSPAASGDFLYVEDACDAVIAALDHPAPGSVYNIGSGEETCLADLAAAVWTTLRPDERPRIERGDAPGRRFVLDIHRATKELLYRPRHSLRDGLAAWREAEGQLGTTPRQAGA